MQIADKAFRIVGTLFVALLALSWDAHTLRAQVEVWPEVDCAHCDKVNAIAWSPDGRRFALANAAGLWLYDDQMKLLSWPSSGRVTRIAWSQDSMLLAAVREDDHTPETTSLTVWNAGSGQRVMTLPTITSIVSISWSPKANVLAYTYDEVVKLWNADTGRTRTVMGIPTEVTSVGFKEWGYIWWVAWTPAGDRIAIGTGSMGLYFWNVSTGMIDQTLGGDWGANPSIAWDPQGKRLVITPYARYVPNLFDTTSGTVTELPLRRDNGGYWFVDQLAWSPDGQLLATDGFVGEVALWDRSTWQRVGLLRKLPVEVTALAWSRDSQRLAVGYVDGTVHIWARPVSQ